MNSIRLYFKDEKFHLQLRNEIWLIALNRSVKYDEEYYRYQQYDVHNALFRLVRPTMTDPRGISMLGSVRKIFDACHLELDEVKTKIEQFEIDDGRKRWYEAPKNSRTIKEGTIF